MDPDLGCASVEPSSCIECVFKYGRHSYWVPVVAKGLRVYDLETLLATRFGFTSNVKCPCRVLVFHWLPPHRKLRPCEVVLPGTCVVITRVPVSVSASATVTVPVGMTDGSLVDGRDLLTTTIPPAIPDLGDVCLRTGSDEVCVARVPKVVVRVEVVPGTPTTPSWALLWNTTTNQRRVETFEGEIHLLAQVCSSPDTYLPQYTPTLSHMRRSLSCCMYISCRRTRQQPRTWRWTRCGCTCPVRGSFTCGGRCVRTRANRLQPWPTFVLQASCMWCGRPTHSCVYSWLQVVGPVAAGRSTPQPRPTTWT